MFKKQYSIIIMVFFVLLFASNSIGGPLTPAACKAKVQAAVKLVESKGEAAYDTLRDPNGEFIFADGAGYVWIHDLQGIMLMHPIKPTLEGKALFGLKDSAGVYFFVAFNEIVEESGSGWVPYQWPKPGQEASSPKVSFVMSAMHSGKTYIVGSGMYDVTGPSIKKEFPNDNVYEH